MHHAHLDIVEPAQQKCQPGADGVIDLDHLAQQQHDESATARTERENTATTKSSIVVEATKKNIG